MTLQENVWYLTNREGQVEEFVMAVTGGVLFKSIAWKSGISICFLSGSSLDNFREQIESQKEKK
jgi:hypothetical protein